MFEFKKLFIKCLSINKNMARHTLSTTTLYPTSKSLKEKVFLPRDTLRTKTSLFSMTAQYLFHFRKIPIVLRTFFKWKIPCSFQKFSLTEKARINFKVR
jgi:hypothetical protein